MSVLMEMSCLIIPVVLGLWLARVESVVPLRLFWALLGFMLLRALSLRSKT